MNEQPSLLDWVPPTPRGKTFSEQRDGKRLRGQALRVYTALQSGAWFTLRQLSDAADAPEASASARIRDLRAAGYPVESLPPKDGGTWKYRINKGADNEQRGNA